MNRDFLILGAIGAAVYFASKSGIFTAVSNVAAFGSKHPAAFQAAGQIVSGTATVITEVGNIWEGVQSMFGGFRRGNPAPTDTSSALFPPNELSWAPSSTGRASLFGGV